MFTLTNAYDNPKHSKLTRLKNRFKFVTYSIMHELLQCQFQSATLFSFLILVEAGQFLWFAIHPDYKFLWQTSFAQYPRDIVKYLQVDALFREGDTGIYYTVLYLLAAVILAILLCILIILIKFNASSKKNSTIVYYLLRLLSLCAVLLITIGPIPLFQTFLEALVCESNDPLENDSECYKGIHLANTICGALALFFTLGFTIISQMLFIDFNPASKIPFAGPQSIIGFFKLALKFGITLYYALDHDLSDAKVFVIIYAILWLFTLILRYNSRGYYNEHVNLVTTITESVVTWAAVTCVFHAYIDAGEVDDIGLYFFLCAAPFAGYTYYIIFMYQRWGGMRINIRKMKKIYEIEKFLNIACSLIENKEKPQARIELEGLLRYHTRICRKDSNDCLCYYLSQNIASSDPNGEEKKLWYRFLNSLISDAIVKFPKNCHLRLQHAYFQQDRLGNNFKALFELMKSEEIRPDIQQEFSVFRYKNIIEKEMMEIDIRHANSRGVDVNMVVHFQEKFVVFQKEIGKSVKMQLNFWQELEQSTPNVQQLLLLGSKITVQAEVVQNAYSQLSAINPNHIRTLKIYGNFLQDIMNDSFEAQRIIEKAEYAEKSLHLDKGFLETDRLKYGENSKTCIIMCSGNIHTMGKILDANTETMNMLNFTHTEIIGQSVNQMMPEIIGTHHDALMMKYFDTCVPSVIGRERPVFPMNKAGYIIPCSLMIKIYPNLDYGIRVVGFMRRMELNSSVAIKPKVGEEIIMSSLRTHYIMYGGENNEIYSVTEGCFDSFGIPASLANGTDPEFTIETIFPELHEDDCESLKTQSGLLTTIDTTSLPEDFLVGLNPVDSMGDSQNEKKIDFTEKENLARYRSAQVRVTLIEDSNFLGKLRIKIIKLVEVNDSNNKQAQSAAINNTDETQLNKGSEDNLNMTHENESEIPDDEEQQLEARSEASNFSLMMGEDMRQLKDMKAKISEKNTPSSITFLKATSLIMSALLIALTAVQLSQKKSFHDQLTFGFQAVKTSVLRHFCMADINYLSRVLFGSEGGYLGSIDLPIIRYYMGTILEDFEEAQFGVSQAKMVQNQTDKNATWIRLPTYNLLPDGIIALHTANINHAYYQYLASAQRYLDIPFSEFHSSDGYTTAESAFYFLRRNGLTTLRAASESVVEQYSGYYEEKSHQFTDFFLATMLVGIVFLLASMLIMLPKIFSVNKTNMKVLSLFGYILPQEVQKLAEKCEQYMEEHLDEAAFQREYSSYFSESNSEEHQQLTKQPDESLLETPHHKKYLTSVEEANNESITSGGQDFTLQMKEFSEHEDFRKPPVLISGRSSLHSPGRSVVMPSTARDDKPLIHIRPADETHRSSISVEIGMREKDNNKEKKEVDEKEDNEELQEYLHDRSKKLRNSPDHSKKGVILRMVIFASVFIGFFLGDFLHELFFFRNYRYAVSHLVLICERASNIKFVQTFTQEEIYENNLTSAYPTYPTATVATKNTRIEYADKVLASQVSIKDSYTLPFPYQFDKYFDTLLSFDNNNMCDAFYTDKTLAAYTTCETAGEGKLKLGMIQAETSMLGTLDTLMKSFYNTANRDKQTQIDLLTSGDLLHVAELVASLRPIQNSLLQMFVEANDDYFDDTAWIEDIKFIAFLIVLFVLQVFVLFPYLERLRQHIFRTKALLNMIPMSMLKKNKTLQETFVSKEVFQALK